MRDIFTHKLTTPQHFHDLLVLPFYTRSELAYENYVTDGTEVLPSYDPHCENGDISGGCEPVAVISADMLLDYTEGPGETTAIATALMNDQKTGQFVIDPEAWDCIWEELIQSKKGPKIMADRPGYQAPDGHSYNFSHEMLEAMIEELNRLINKYGGDDWNSYPTAIRLVDILTGHRAVVQKELDELNTGIRRLKGKDYLGPKERARRRETRNQEEYDDTKDQYFISLEQKRLHNKRRAVEGAVQEDETVNDHDNKNARKKMSDADFIGALSNALSKIRKLQEAGEMGRKTAMDLVERVREVAMEARVVMGDETGASEESQQRFRRLAVSLDI